MPGYAREEDNISLETKDEVIVGGWIIEREIGLTGFSHGSSSFLDDKFTNREFTATTWSGFKCE